MTDRFLRACRRKAVDCTPVWFMRQAGRYQKEYRQIRQKHSLLEVVKTPELAARVTMLPIEQFDVDAAIIFADILPPLEPMGIDLEYVSGKGPVIHNPVRDRDAVDALQVIQPMEELPFTFEAIRLVRQELDGEVPLIGFSGAPFTLGSYVIEGGSSRHYREAKGMMYEEPDAWQSLMEKLTKVVISYLRGQIEAGAQAVQLFDSWVGCLSPDDYRQYVFPYSQQIFQALADEDVPTIHFGTNTAGFLETMKAAGGDVISVDWRMDLGNAWRRLGDDVAVQGNLDPIALFAPLPEIERRVEAILESVGDRPGHIFNLGHGILPETPVEHVRAVAEMVHQKSRRK